MKLFSTSGIRRKVANLQPDFVVKIGLAISESICNNDGSTVLLARDARSSGPQVEHAISAGLLAGGVNIERMGIVPTPALAYHTFKKNAKAGVMLTASHNPPEYNGIKVFDQTSMGLSPEDEKKIEDAFAKNKSPVVSWEKFGQDIQIPGSELYDKMLLDAASKIDFTKFDTIIADPGGGASCEVVSNVYKNLGMDLVVINSLFDPYFSARYSEPVPKNLSDILSLMRKRFEKGEKKNIGLAYDGDGDRCLAIDEKGRYIPQDVLISLYAKYVIEKNNGKGVIISHIDASMLLEKLVVEAGGTVKRTKVGDVAIGNLVSKEKALFGGEPCGAWIHPEYHLCPDGPLTGLKILEWASECGPLSELVDSVNDYPVTRTKVACDNALKSKVMKTLDDQHSSKDEFKEILTIDGIRFSYEDDSWILIRPSGTEPYIRITSQALTDKEAQDRLDHYTKLVTDEIKKTKK